MISFTMDDSRFRSQLHRYVDELHRDGKEVVRDQTRLLLKQVIHFTPPKTLAQGRAAVARDLTRSMTPISLDYFKRPRTDARVAQLASSGNIAGLQGVIRNSGNFPGYRVEQFAEQLHTFARDNRGRVRRNRKILVPEIRGKRSGQWERYLKRLQSYVGRLKAAWGPCYTAVGGTLPAWVKRHGNPRGAVTIHFGDKARPSIEFRNFATGVGQLHRPFAAAMRVRAKAMGRDIARKLREAGKKAGFK